MPPAEQLHNAPEFTVSELSQSLKRTVEDTYGHVRVRGEISGFRGAHSSGHCYFALKDESAKIEAVIWKGVHGRMRFKPQEGLEVIGLGEQKTPQPFVKACDKFIYTELLRDDASEAESPATQAPEPPEAKPATGNTIPTEAAPTDTNRPKVPVKLITKVIDDISDEDGWAHMAALGENLRKLKSDFDPRLYGFKKLTDLIKARNGHFELQERGVTATGGKILFVKNRRTLQQQ